MDWGEILKYSSKLGFVWGAAKFAFRLGVTTVLEVSESIKAEKLTTWLKGLEESNLSDTIPSWKTQASKFWLTQDSNKLWDVYYRGMPLHLVEALKNYLESKADLEKQNSIHYLLQDAKETCLNLLSKIPANEFDNIRGHRLQVYDTIFKIQLLPYVFDSVVHSELNRQIEHLLIKTQGVETGYTESGSGQIQQIVSQVLTDQLISGPNAWQRLMITNAVLARLCKLGLHVDLAHQFESGLAYSLQFLAYYRISLENPMKKKLFGTAVATQKNMINDYFQTLLKCSDPVIKRVIPWLKRVEQHAEMAMDQKLYNCLMRDSSSGIVAKYYGTSFVPDSLYELCIVNNLRSAYIARGLPDEEDQRRRVIDFFASNGINRLFGHRIVDKTLRDDSTGFYQNAKSVVEELPVNIREPEIAAPLYSTNSVHTFDKLLSFLPTPSEPNKVAHFKFTNKELSKIVAKSISNVIVNIWKKTANFEKKRINQQDEIRKIIDQVIQKYQK